MNRKALFPLSLLTAALLMAGPRPGPNRPGQERNPGRWLDHQVPRRPTRSLQSRRKAAVQGFRAMGEVTRASRGLRP